MKKMFQTLCVAACVLATVSSPSQITNAPAASPTSASFGDGLKIIGDAVSSSTNWTAITGYGHSTKGQNNVAFAALAYNFNANVGLVAGYDYLWSGQSHTFNSVKGGVTLQLPMHPFAFLGSTVLTNIVATPFVADMVATPQSGSTIGNLISTGINFDVYAWKNFEIVSGLQYEQRNGQGGWDGNYVLFHLGLSRRF